MAEAPGHVTRFYGELAELFASGAWRDGESARRRRRFRERFCEFDDGLAAERVVRTLMLGEPMPGRAAGTGRVPPGGPPVAAGRALTGIGTGGRTGIRSRGLTRRGDERQSR